MKKNIQNAASLVVTLSLFWVTSCRTTDSENSLSASGISAVNVNLLGTAFTDLSGNAQASTGKSGTIADVVQSHSVLVDPSHVISVEYAPATTSLKTSAGINPVAVISGNPLTQGMKFRVIAYNNSTTAESYSDYTIGAGNSIQGNPLMLSHGVNYTIVAYSYGSAYLPLYDASATTLPYSDDNRDFMFVKTSFTPNGANTANTIPITLNHKTTEITTKIDATANGNITNIQNAKITPHYTTATISLADGSISNYANAAANGVPLVFPNVSTAATTQTANKILINANSSSPFNYMGSFSADIAIGGSPSKTVSLPNSFQIIPGYRKILTIKFARCGASINGTNRYFMCHNLGADYSQDPNNPSNNALVHGAKYFWGAKTPTVTQTDDQASPNISITNNGDTNANAWAGANYNNPCPTGYRVPTKEELTSLSGLLPFNNDDNNFSSKGSWNDSTTSYDSFRIYTSRSDNTLSIALPAAGYRNSSGDIIQRGSAGRYWSSDNNGGLHAYHLLFGNLLNQILSGGTASGLSVRCIAN
ncbi:hypothetical protein HZQ11_15890 [Elizabethkingia anophelis]|uniref:FISUMP domain-containing protein n=1 Tax=Elizabethkingia TaxID=308865 RepID=UPI0007398F06|nr:MULTISPECIES: FISUMP domain-containing protein [Elizabethkingia]KUF44583.1 hypothetical protein AS358_05095 [Elizabethkingia anophelis]MCT3645614.1 hypothetical protein [Elizabethkingia anophelis]MCT3652990.1 hypothetical protein [Elizabethkingia anophelis]MCT3656765.1 hypothetical protein [Elizabethkingia anophelis]MCT3660266.1 hypothetical protein [Elizabethkingia anophelis]